MARPPKFKQRNPKGCKLCGDLTVGRGIQMHVKKVHKIPYKTYLACFESGGILLDKLIDTGHRSTSKIRGTTSKVIIHILVRRFSVPIE
jgi:hypothetical protein